MSWTFNTDIGLGCRDHFISAGMKTRKGVLSWTPDLAAIWIHAVRCHPVLIGGPLDTVPVVCRAEPNDHSRIADSSQRRIIPVRRTQSVGFISHRAEGVLHIRTAREWGWSFCDPLQGTEGGSHPFVRTIESPLS